LRSTFIPLLLIFPHRNTRGSLLIASLTLVHLAIQNTRGGGSVGGNIAVKLVCAMNMMLVTVIVVVVMIVVVVVEIAEVVCRCGGRCGNIVLREACICVLQGWRLEVWLKVFVQYKFTASEVLPASLINTLRGARTSGALGSGSFIHI
jgi:hypothetical protein